MASVPTQVTVVNITPARLDRGAVCNEGFIKLIKSHP